jgi:hypothetical protein
MKKEILNFKKIKAVVFPEFTGVTINMMPFIIGDIKTIPEEVQNYIPLIESCCLPESLTGQVAYLTITETLVKEGETQRKKGIHLDFGKGGFAQEKKDGEGIYIANNIEGSCRIWDTRIPTSDVQNNGSCEHLRATLGNGEFLKQSVMYLIHENCPHESLPMASNTKRQFFRLVVGEIMEWYEEFSTRNRLGVKPDCKVVYYTSLSEGCHGACW